jgi:hypothetical protein
MKGENQNNFGNCRNQPGIVLLVTLVLLVVISTLGYTLSTRLGEHRHRCQYVIDYQAARYGCDSAVKYALASLEEISPELISRPNEPDFSDLFYLSEEEYQELLDEAAALALDRAEDANDTNDVNDIDYRSYLNEIGDINDINDINDVNDIGISDYNDANSVFIRGPYGPPWPFVTEPAEIEIGSAKVRIEIEDENAKYPAGWMLLDKEAMNRELVAGFETFCEWMDVDEEQIDTIIDELEQVKEIKPFKLEFKPMKKRTPIGRKPQSGRRGRRASRSAARRYKTTITSVSQQVADQATDVSKLLHSSLVDIEALARPTIISESRKESALKYMGMWGSRKVNINTAPRQVLEAAFTFGGDADRIAEEIILRRRVKPFSDLDDFKQSLFGYSDSIRKCEDYITTSSSFFTIRVTATSGVAEALAIIAITKEGEKTHKIAVISG